MRGSLNSRLSPSYDKASGSQQVEATFCVTREQCGGKPKFSHPEKAVTHDSKDQRGWHPGRGIEPQSRSSDPCGQCGDRRIRFVEHCHAAFAERIEKHGFYRAVVRTLYAGK